MHAKQPFSRPDHSTVTSLKMRCVTSLESDSHELFTQLPTIYVSLWPLKKWYYFEGYFPHMFQDILCCCSNISNVTQRPCFLFKLAGIHRSDWARAWPPWRHLVISQTSPCQQWEGLALFFLFFVTWPSWESKKRRVGEEWSKRGWGIPLCGQFVTFSNPIFYLFLRPIPFTLCLCTLPSRTRPRHTSPLSILISVCCVYVYKWLDQLDVVSCVFSG